MDPMKRVKDISAKFLKDREKIEDRIERLSLELEAPGNEKRNFSTKSWKEIQVEKIHALKDELRIKLIELKVFQSRVAEIISLSSANLDQKLHLECEIFSRHLPIYRFRSKILESIQKNDVTVLVADTGSGKSTLVTQFLHAYDEEMVIYCCEPRRFAAEALIKYTNTCLGLDPEEAIVAFDFNEWDTNFFPGKSKIVYATNNGLLSRWRDDHYLKEVDVVIIDEPQERTLSTDILLGIMKKLHKTKQLREKSLKTLIMSSTIDPSIFYNYFSSSEISVNCISVPGTTFPVQVIYDKTPLSIQPQNYVTRTTSKILEILQIHESGDVLAFLATPPEIEEAVDILEKGLTLINRNVKVYPFYSSVEIDDQIKLFSKDGDLKNEQRVIISTNIAENSVFLPDIICVIDSGRQKEFSFDIVRNVDVLTLSSISKNSAIQRMGRAGRTRPGTCYRLYTKNDFDDFISSSSPKMCVPLDQVLLSLFHLGFSNPENFDFIDPPLREAIAVGIDSLSSFGAIECHCSIAKIYLITKVGTKMIKLDVIPKLAHLIVNTLNLHKDLILDVLIICGVVSSGYGIFYLHDNIDEAKNKNLSFCDDKSDFITMINAFKAWYGVSLKDRSVWARKNMISHKRMNETLKFVRQNIRVLETRFNCQILRKKEELRFGCSKDRHDVILNLIHSSFRKSIAVFSGHPRAGYINTINGEVMMLHPSSSINCLKNNLKYACYDKILTTSKTCIFHVSMVESKWLDEEDVFINSQTEPKTVRKYEGYQMMGSHTLEKYVLNELQQLRKDLTRKISNNSVEKEITNFFEIDVELQKGSITTWCHPENESIVIPSVKGLLNTALEKVMNETMTISLRSELFVLVIGASGSGMKHFNLKTYVRFKIVAIDESDEVELPLKDIQELMAQNSINFHFSMQGSEPCLSFKTSQIGIKARSLILDNYSDTLNCIWTTDDLFNVTRFWVVYHFYSYEPIDEVVKAVQKLIDKEKNNGTVVEAMPLSNEGRLDLKVNVPTLDIGESMYRYRASCERFYHLHSTLYAQEVFCIPSRASSVVKMELRGVKNVSYRDKEGGDTLISVIHSRNSNSLYSRNPSSNNTRLLELIKGTLVCLENFSSSFNMKDSFKKIIKDIENNLKVVIHKENNTHCLTFRIFGKNVQDAKKKIVSYFNNLGSSTLTIPFEGKKVLPTLINKYGVTLAKLYVQSGVYNVEVCLKKRIIVITGREVVLNVINKEFSDLFALHYIDVNNFHDPCIVCEVSPPSGYNCRLQLCEHNICHKCLPIFVNYSDIPLKCPVQECDTPISVEDIKDGLNNSNLHIFYEKCRKNYLLSCPSGRRAFSSTRNLNSQKEKKKIKKTVREYLRRATLSTRDLNLLKGMKKFRKTNGEHSGRATLSTRDLDLQKGKEKTNRKYKRRATLSSRNLYLLRSKEIDRKTNGEHSDRATLSTCDLDLQKGKKKTTRKYKRRAILSTSDLYLLRSQEKFGKKNGKQSGRAILSTHNLDSQKGKEKFGKTTGSYSSVISLLPTC